MDRRSTSAEYTHFGGDVTAQVNSSHGVRLSGGSTGGIVEAVGDDTNVSLRLRAQGSGPITIGTSSNAVTAAGGLTAPLISTGITSTHINLQSTRVSIGSSAAGISTSYLMRVWRERIDFTVPVMAVNAGAEVGDIAVTGLTTNAVITISPRGPLNSTVAGLMAMAFCSTAGQVHLTLQNAGTTISGSTMSAYAMFHDWNIPA
jgi:hypothetical protein